MNFNAKLIHKYPEKKGWNGASLKDYRCQQMKFAILTNDKEQGGEILANCFDPDLLDIHSLQVGAIGTISLYLRVEECNGTAHQRIIFNGWEPQSK